MYKTTPEHHDEIVSKLAVINKAKIEYYNYSELTSIEIEKMEKQLEDTKSLVKSERKKRHLLIHELQKDFFSTISKVRQHTLPLDENQELYDYYIDDKSFKRKEAGNAVQV